MSKYIWWCCLLLWPSALIATCPQLVADEIAVVRYIVDGDTIILQDGRAVRFIGIDTPELNTRQQRPAEPGAIAARSWLQKQLPLGQKIKLTFGRQQRDKYGRRLAHPLTQDGHLLVSRMLELGLGRLLQISPNHKYWSCLLNAEQRARQQALGIWPANFVHHTVGRTQLLWAKVVRSHQGRGIIKLELAVKSAKKGKLTLLASHTLTSSAKQKLARLKAGEWLFVRGQIKTNRRGQSVLWLNHPWQFY